MDGLTTAAEGVIEREIRIDARPETVFLVLDRPGQDGPLDGPATCDWTRGRR
jgi:hypothetical protein